MKKLLNGVIWIAALGASIEWYIKEFKGGKRAIEWVATHPNRCEQITEENDFFEGVRIMMEECRRWKR